MIPPNDQRPPADRPLRIAPFAAQAARGLVRDQSMRRKAMFWTVLLAVVMLFVGATFLAPWLDPKIRPGWFMLYWLACAWVTVTAVLLAIFDLLMMRVVAREEKRRLAREVTEQAAHDDAA